MLKVLIALAAMAACTSAASTTGAPSTVPGSGEVNAINLGAAALCLSDGEAAGVLIGTGLIAQEDIVDVVEIDGELVVIIDTSRVDPDTILSIIGTINSSGIDGSCAGTIAASGTNADTSDYDSGSLAKINFCVVTGGTGRQRRGMGSSKSKKSSKGDEDDDCVEIVQPRQNGKKGKKDKKGKKTKSDSKKSKKSKKTKKGDDAMYASRAGWASATAAQKSVYVLGSMATVAVGLALVVAGIRRKNKRAGYREIENAEEKPKQAATSEDAKETSPFLTKI
jgi:hypothetical protein